MSAKEFLEQALYPDLPGKVEEVRAVIERISKPLIRAVLVYRYLHGLPWEDIANRLHYSQRHIARLHFAGLRAVRDIIAAQRFERL
jgi:DNA-directed RNA polymerase specialized sigma24 family protein